MPDVDPQLLKDIRLRLEVARLRPVYAVDRDERRVTVGDRSRLLADIGVVSGRKNLEQAIVLRLLTPRGELAALGHPAYGSRIHELIGRADTENTRNRLRLFILEALQAEGRIAEIREVSVGGGDLGRGAVTVRLRVVPIGETDLLDVGPFTLELG
jgi:phage baseplate assembly protein W